MSDISIEVCSELERLLKERRALLEKSFLPLGSVDHVRNHFDIQELNSEIAIIVSSRFTISTRC